jgi:hypothetical protein
MGLVAISHNEDSSCEVLATGSHSLSGDFTINGPEIDSVPGLSHRNAMLPTESDSNFALQDNSNYLCRAERNFSESQKSPACVGISMHLDFLSEPAG